MKDTILQEHIEKIAELELDEPEKYIPLKEIPCPPEQMKFI